MVKVSTVGAIALLRSSSRTKGHSIAFLEAKCGTNGPPAAAGVSNAEEARVCYIETVDLILLWPLQS